MTILTFFRCTVRGNPQIFQLPSQQAQLTPGHEQVLTRFTAYIQILQHS